MPRGVQRRRRAHLGRTRGWRRRNGEHGWSGWSCDWDAEPGDHELCVRATDRAGNAQPLDSAEAWNQGGYGVNAVQRVAVRVT